MDTIERTRITPAEAREHLVNYVSIIDDGKLQDWPTTFADPCLYRITTRQNEARRYKLSIMLCDNQAMLFDRVEAIEQANVFEPHTYRHILSDSRVLNRGQSSITIETSFICVRTMISGAQMLFASGRYVDELVRVDGAARYRSKIVILDSSEVDTLLAIPL
jgi:anthranilate 1,2-dioxygenase small subunit